MLALFLSEPCGSAAAFGLGPSGGFVFPPLVWVSGLGEGLPVRICTDFSACTVSVHLLAAALFSVHEKTVSPGTPLSGILGLSCFHKTFQSPPGKLGPSPRFDVPISNIKSLQALLAFLWARLVLLVELGQPRRAPQWWWGKAPLYSPRPLSFVR